MKYFDCFSDNVYIKLFNILYGGFIENCKFNCVGNELVINDCLEIEKRCLDLRDIFKRIEIICESKMYFKYNILN